MSSGQRFMIIIIGYLVILVAYPADIYPDDIETLV